MANDENLVEFVKNNQQLRSSDVLVKHHFFEVMMPVEVPTQPMTHGIWYLKKYDREAKW